MSDTSESNTAFCINCGEEISADTQFCPKCGSSQDPSEFQEDTEETNHGGFTSWAIGFRPGKTGRNVLVAFAYFFFYFIGGPLLLYSYIQQKPGKAKYVAYIGGGFLLLMSLAAFAQGGRRGIIAGVVAALLGAFFLPIVRKKIGVGGVPGIDVDESARRSFVVGSGYALGSMVLVGIALPTPENTDTSGSGGTSGSGSNDGTEQSVQARIGAVDVDVQTDIGRNNIGFDVETYFETSAVLTVIVSDGEASDQRSFEATATDGFQEFNDDIEPPDTFQDDEEFTIMFTLSVDGEIVDEKQFTHTYSE